MDIASSVSQELEKNRQELNLVRNQRSKGGKGKMKKSIEFVINHFKENRDLYENKNKYKTMLAIARAIYKLLKKKDFANQGSETFSSEKQALRTISEWIKKYKAHIK